MSHLRHATSGIAHKVRRLPPASALTQRPACSTETDACVDPYKMLKDHPDITLLIRRLQEGEKGRWYPGAHVIVIDDRLSQAERRCVLMHELLHRARGDVHQPDDRSSGRQERACHQMVARMLIPFPQLQAAMQWGRDPQELADELWVDVKTLRARVMGLSPAEAKRLAIDLDLDDRWSVA